jgi:hypothetical protein
MIGLPKIFGLVGVGGKLCLISYRHLTPSHSWVVGVQDPSSFWDGYSWK